MYLPLQFYNQINISDISAKQPLKPYLMQMVYDDEMYSTLCLDNDLFTDKIQGAIAPFSNEIRKHWRTIYKWASGTNPQHSVFTVNYKKFVRNNFIHMIIANRWGKFKKVYKFDPELEFTLCDTDKIKIPISLLKNLPYKDFYFHFAEDGIFSDNFHGSFISYIETEKICGLSICRVNHKFQTMAGFISFEKDEDDYFLMQTEDIDWRRLKGADSEVCADWNEFCFFAVNAILYLCAANAEIRELDEKTIPTKLLKSMAKRERENNKTDYLQCFECGYRYGQTIRAMKQQKEKNEITTITVSKNKRKKPRPHPVKASWQHYWIGKKDGERQRILKFKAPYYQGGTSKIANISKVI